MKQVQISHPALVALQGRLKGIQDLAARVDTWADDHNEHTQIKQEAQAAIYVIDDWLTDPGMQAPQADPTRLEATEAATRIREYWVPALSKRYPRDPAIQEVIEGLEIQATKFEQLASK